jgi:hypothetical protein
MQLKAVLTTDPAVARQMNTDEKEIFPKDKTDHQKVRIPLTADQR